MGVWPIIIILIPFAFFKKKKKLLIINRVSKFNATKDNLFEKHAKAFCP